MIYKALVKALVLSTLLIATAAQADITVCRAPFQTLLGKAFAAYPVTGSTHTIQPVAADVSKGKAHLFRTVLRQGARLGPNFAGHYTIIEIGCGAGTTCLAVADALTGAIFFPKAVTTASDVMIGLDNERIKRFNFRPNSASLVIVGTINERLDRYGMHHFVWRAGQLRLVRFIPIARLCGEPASTG